MLDINHEWSEGENGSLTLTSSDTVNRVTTVFPKSEVIMYTKDNTMEEFKKYIENFITLKMVINCSAVPPELLEGNNE